MVIEKKLYSSKEVGQIIKLAVEDISQKLGSGNVSIDKEEVILKEWAQELLPTVEDAVAEEVVKRHVVGVTFSVWAGPPGSGKGTNIEAVNLLGKVYAEVASQGIARLLPEPFHSFLLKRSVSQSLVSTGTGGMFHNPKGEYEELFGGLVKFLDPLVAGGGFVPDDLVSVLVELMVLYRLTENNHKIQIDLWPRTSPQFGEFHKMVNKIKQSGGKVTEEIVSIKVLQPESLSVVKNNLQAVAEVSKQIGEKIQETLTAASYQEALRQSAVIQDSKQRFSLEAKVLEELLQKLTTEFPSEVGKAVLDELKTVCERMQFRFTIVLEKGGTPRDDEYPLNVIRRLGVYTSKTSPVFLEGAAVNGPQNGYFVVSSAGTPEEVIKEILETLAGQSSDDPRWLAVEKIAGEIADAIVYKKELIVDSLVQRVGGILNS